MSTLLNNRITDELFEMARRKRKNVLEQQKKSKFYLSKLN